MVQGLFAVNYLRLGNYQLASDAAQKVLDLAAQAGLLIAYAREGYQSVSDVLLTLWDNAGDQNTRQEYAELAGRSLIYSRRLGGIFPVMKPRHLLLQGRYDWLSGKHRKAQKAWLKGIELSLGLDMPHEAGLLHLEYGRHLPHDDTEREMHLERALELFTNVEANYYTDLTREELNTTV